MQNALIERDIVKELKEHLEEKEITLLLGPRQSGKTTVLKQLESSLLASGKKTKFFNLDILADQEIVADQTVFIEFLRSFSSDERAFIFIDEVQRIAEPGVFLKGVFDSEINCKLILSGSSSLEIKSKIVEPLTGRKRTFYLPTVTFSEFVRFSDSEISHLGRSSEAYARRIKKLFDQYISYGGYPRVVIEEDPEKKIRILEEIYTSYIEKDIELFFEVRSRQAFLKLVNVVAANLGGILNKEQIASEIGSNRATVENFLSYLEASFVIFLLFPFFRRKKREIVKSPKAYFADLGLRNLLVKNFSPFESRSDKGELFENFIHNEIRNDLSPVTKLNFWRTRTGAEVDFVLSSAGRVEAAIEAKARNLKRQEIPGGLTSFIREYEPELAVVVNLILNDKTVILETKMEFVSFDRFAKFVAKLP